MFTAMRISGACGESACGHTGDNEDGVECLEYQHACISYSDILTITSIIT